MEIWELGELFSEHTRRRIQRKLREADLNIAAEHYLGWLLVLSLILFILTLPLSIPLSLIVLFLSLGTGLYLPSYLSYLRASRAEREMPFFLKSLSTFLKSGIDPLSALKLSSQGNPTFSSIVSRILKLHSTGISLRRAFEREAENISSEKVSRTLLMIYQVIDGGYGTESLDRYADSLLHSRRIEIREFSSKLALYTLIFIALTGLVPSILLMYSLLLPTVFGGAMDPAVILFTLFFLVPLLTVLTLGYMSGRVSA